MNLIERLIKLQDNAIKISECSRIVKCEPQVRELMKIKQSFDAMKVDCTQRSRKLKLVKDEMALTSGDMNELKDIIKEDEKTIYDGDGSDYKVIEKLQDRVDVNKGKVNQLETYSMDLMEKEENLSDQKSKMIGQLENMRNTYKTRKGEVESDMKKAKKKLDALKAEKTKLEKDVPAELLEQFNATLKLRKTAVAKLENGMCTGCNMGVSSITATDVKGKDGYAICENCGRILYVEE